MEKGTTKKARKSGGVKWGNQPTGFKKLIMSMRRRTPTLSTVIEYEPDANNSNGIHPLSKNFIYDVARENMERQFKKARKAGKRLTRTNSGVVEAAIRNQYPSEEADAILRELYNNMGAFNKTRRSRRR